MLQIKVIDDRLTEHRYGLGYATQGSAAFDLRACGRLVEGADGKLCHEPIEEAVDLYPGEEILLSAGLEMALPYGHAGMILPRSGLAIKEGIVLSNLVGLIDEDYRNIVGVALWNRKQPGSAGPVWIEPMMRIAQMMVTPVARPEMVLVETLEETQRYGGFGSTGVA